MEEDHGAYRDGLDRLLLLTASLAMVLSSCCGGKGKEASEMEAWLKQYGK